MTPREFLNTYGPLRNTSIAAGSIAPRIVTANPDRYLLIFWSAANLYRFQIGIHPFPLPAPTNIPAGSLPTILTHALHGTAVNEAYSIDHNATDVVFSEAFMIGSGQTTMVDVSEEPKLPTRRVARSVTGTTPPALLEEPETALPPLPYDYRDNGDGTITIDGQRYGTTAATIRNEGFDRWRVGVGVRRHVVVNTPDKVEIVSAFLAGRPIQYDPTRRVYFYMV